MVSTVVPEVGKLFVGGIYRPPDKPMADFYQYADDLLNHFGNRKAALSGDFNVDFNSEGPVSARFCEFVISYGVRNEIDRATYVSSSTGAQSSCLDHCWHNFHFDT